VDPLLSSIIGTYTLIARIHQISDYCVSAFRETERRKETTSRVCKEIFKGLGS